MTRYVVQVSRWYEVKADCEEDAMIAAGELDDDGETRNEEEPIMNATDLDSIEALAKCGAGQPGREP